MPEAVGEIRRLNIVSSGFKSTMLSPDSRQVALRSSMVADSTAPIGVQLGHHEDGQSAIEQGRSGYIALQLGCQYTKRQYRSKA